MTMNGGKRPSRASSEAPISDNGSATRSTGRRRIDASPSSIHAAPGWPASQPGSRRISVPALPTSIAPVTGAGARSPGPRTTSSPGRSSTSAPSACTARRVERVSSASR